GRGVPVLSPRSARPGFAARPGAFPGTSPGTMGAGGVVTTPGPVEPPRRKFMSTVTNDGRQDNATPSRRGFLGALAGGLAGAAVPVAAAGAVAPAPDRSGPPGLGLCPLCGEDLEPVGEGGMYECPDCRDAAGDTGLVRMQAAAELWAGTQLHA